MQHIVIRPIERKDNKAVAAIIRNAFSDFNAPTCGTVFEDPSTDHLFELFRAKGSVLLVAKDDTKVLGCCGLFPTEGLPENCAELVKFYLSAAARGKGVGKKLLAQCLQLAPSLGYRQVYLESLPQFSKAVGIYEKLGFRQLDQPMGKSGHTGCTIWMLKDLPG